MTETDTTTTPETPPPAEPAADMQPPADTPPTAVATEPEPEPTPAHLCSNGHPCTCPDIPTGGHGCGRTPEFEPDGPHAEEARRVAALEPAA